MSNHTFYYHECLACTELFVSPTPIPYHGCPYCGSRMTRIVHEEDCSGDEDTRPIGRREEE